MLKAVFECSILYNCIRITAVQLDIGVLYSNHIAVINQKMILFHYRSSSLICAVGVGLNISKCKWVCEKFLKSDTFIY